jgi:hypothetical protein
MSEKVLADYTEKAGVGGSTPLPGTIKSITRKSRKPEARSNAALSRLGRIMADAEYELTSAEYAGAVCIPMAGQS